jgi:asparagine synthase (glutamine-hydrolysing)
MCGIAGIRSLGDRPVLGDEVLTMADVITHRGPDDFGLHLDSGLGLAMRRLQIIDLATGKQPIHNEDQSVWVVLNGEIYNFREKRRELEARGHRFYTATDTEVIVHLYDEFGTACVEHLRGMFAFALWDAKSRSLLLARDRLGIKPLYYGVFGNRLVFASELKCLLTLPEVERHLDWTALQHLVTFLATPPTQSILQGIHKLEPGHVLVVDEGREPQTRRYWDLDFEPDTRRSEGEVIEELRACLRETVDLHMISDVPLGAFLSGGVDSSAVVATMSGLSDRPVKTFAIGFDEDDYSELDHARLVSRHLGTEHRDQVLEPDVFGVLDDLVWYLDEPFGDSSAIPTYMVSQLAAEEVTVVLSGDGGDEVFAGYDNYASEGRERRWDGLPRGAKALAGLASRLIPEGRPGHAFLSHHALSGADRYLDSVSYFRAEQLRRLFTPEALEKMVGYDPWAGQKRSLERYPDDWLFALQYTDFNHYLPLDILAKVDRMSMAHSIETRVPLLDHVFVETAAKIPSSMKLRDGRRKHVFKEAMKGILPDAILDRRKQGFGVPLDRWFRGRLESYVRDLLLSPRALQRGIFAPEFVRTLLARNNRGRPLGSQLWTLISFELWCRKFLDREVGSERSTVVGDVVDGHLARRA